MSCYAFIPRHYDLKQLNGIHRFTKQLFPEEPKPALKFPKPGQKISLVPSLEALPAPAFPKPWQWARQIEAQIETPVARQEVSTVEPYRGEAKTPAAKYLKALSALAHQEISYEASQEEFDAVCEHFGDVPDHEAFAAGYQQYVADGTAPEELRLAYVHYGWWLNLKKDGAR